jgi:hypothetical protein
MLRQKISSLVPTAVLCWFALTGRAQDSLVEIIFTADVHYGITRAHFQGAEDVPSTVVNKAMIGAIDRLPLQELPAGTGVGSGQPVRYIDELIIAGDIANREEKGIQPAAVSWSQFVSDYTGGSLSIRDQRQQPTPLCLVAGNHDLSDAVGFYKPMTPAHDPSSLVGIYNRMLRPAVPKTSADYDYAKDKIHYSKDIGGVHLLFVNLWPDSGERSWMEADLKKLKPGVPVLLFMHSPPDVESRFFINPNGDHSVNSIDKFENLLADQFRDGEHPDQPAMAEQREFVAFLKKHPAIRACFHGHSNYNEFYDWHGPDNDLTLHCFRTDSPMKGKFSVNDEALLSFQLITIDTKTMTMTVRECLWNHTAAHPAPLQWGHHISIPIGTDPGGDRTGTN